MPSDRDKTPHCIECMEKLEMILPWDLLAPVYFYCKNPKCQRYKIVVVDGIDSDDIKDWKV